MVFENRTAERFTGSGFRENLDTQMVYALHNPVYSFDLHAHVCGHPMATLVLDPDPQLISACTAGMNLVPALKVSAIYDFVSFQE